MCVCEGGERERVVCVCVRERGREADRQVDRQTNTDVEEKRQTNKGIDSDRKRECVCTCIDTNSF